MKNIESNKKILFTVWYADGLHGAVIHIKEIAQYLITKGWDVYCVCVIISEDIKNYFYSNGIKISTADCCDYNLEYDVIWNIHFPLFPFLLKNNIKYKKVIFNSLSPFLEIESPPFFYESYPILLAVSEETKDKMVNYYNIPDKKFKILKNIVPLSYFNVKKTCRKNIKKVVIVSNHVHKELLDSINIFREKGIECDVIGKGYNYIPICPRILLQYDVIITIGKTVQYSLALGIPCYNYDYFGGSGYITENNLKVEEYYNFSGRSFRNKKTPEEIVSEIIADYSSSIKNSEKIKIIAKNEYCISSQIDPIIDYIMSVPNTEIDLKKHSIIIDQYYFLVLSVLNYSAKPEHIILNNDYAKNKKISFIKKIFSVENEYGWNFKHKVVRLLGLKIKFRVI